MAHLGPVPDAPSTVKIRLIGTNSSGKWVNVLHAKYAGGTIDIAALATLAQNVRAAWVTNFAPRLTTSCQLLQVECTDIASRTGAQNVDTVGGAGTIPGVFAPLQVALVVSWKVGTRYRGGHPRMYLAGPDPSQIQTGNTWMPTYVTNVLAAARAFRTAINASAAGGATWQLVAVSYFHLVGGVPAYKVPPDILPIADAAIHTRVDTMRRRLGKEVT
jgi:hypothetical protein